MKARDLAGQRYGKWTVVEQVERTGDHARWLCRCECGAEREVDSHSLTAGKSRGCMRCGRIRHGHAARNTKTREYNTWRGMWRRVRASKVAAPRLRQSEVKAYRGIWVDPRWERFENFFADMGWRPLGMTLDRVDGRKNYGPDNCKWATPTEQNRHLNRS